MELRKCVVCGTVKELNEDNFQPSYDKKQNKIYFKKKCRECEKDSCREYHTNNRDNVLQRKRHYDDDHKEERFVYRKEYNQRPETKKKNAKRALKRYYLHKNDPLFRLRRRVSLSINKQIKRQGHRKGRASILKYLPYTIDELKKHLENQFDPNMFWGNHGTYWHIDHIIPQSDLPYTSMEDDNFKICWALNNLRPLEAKQNISEGARRVRHNK
jgi:hypothetical protein